jgi:hypothetical protein
MSSVVAFARKFAQLKVELSRDSEVDLRLLRLVDFARDTGDTLHNSAFATYLEEWRALVEYQLEGETNLQDLTPDELQRAVQTCRGQVSDNATVTIVQELSKKFCYVGEVEKALTWLDSDDDCDTPDTLSAIPTDVTDEYETARRVLAELPPNSSIANELQQIVREWRLEREALSFDSVKCLFVDRGGHATAGRGRMRTLVCRSADAIQKLETNELVFDNQVRGPDDPFVGASYNALDAIKLLLHRDENKSDRCCLRVHLAIENSDQTFTGDSIALAVALVSYAQLMKPQIHRHERFIAGEIAVTGSLDADGTLAPVNNDSLDAKIKRAFFSPVKYVVVPQANVLATKNCITKLRQQYPRRRLQVIAHERMQDVIDDHNVIRPEKVCMGQFVARKARRYTGSFKIQVPILLGVAWLLLALLLPKYFDPWFDRHIAEVVSLGNRIKAVNPDGHTLWVSSELAGTLREAVGHVYTQLDGSHWVANVDEDDGDELFFAPYIEGLSGRVQLYDDDGLLIWERTTFVDSPYPGDRETTIYAKSQNYGPAKVKGVIGKDGEALIMTACFSSAPARMQIILFDADGQHVTGPYLHTGVVGYYRNSLLLDKNQSGVTDVLLSGMNNRLGRAVIILLDPLDLSGVSPPYTGDLFLESQMQKGGHLLYVSFPKTPLSIQTGSYNSIRAIRYTGHQEHLLVRVAEGINGVIDGKRLVPKEAPSLFYELDSNFIPRRVYFDDGSFRQSNDLLRLTGKVEMASQRHVLDSLLSEVVVYKGNDIIHYLASGIDFYAD